jgi:pyrroline-5-carboxylate reductase
MLNQRIGFIGAGQMATALAQGIVRAGLVPGSAVLASDPHEGARHRFLEAIPEATVTAENHQTAAAADLVVLAVKPQLIDAALVQIQSTLLPATVVVSIAAGVSLARLGKQLSEGTRLIRVMPNTPCLIGRGASAYSLSASATVEDGRLVHQLLSAVGTAHEVPEKLLDAVTGLSGSGPAFVYTFIEALSDGGVLMGLPRELAAALAAQTVAGAAQMVLETQEHPARLRDCVTSPGGTTIAGLEALERMGLRAAMMEAVRAATTRSQELGGPPQGGR